MKVRQEDKDGGKTKMAERQNERTQEDNKMKKRFKKMKEHVKIKLKWQTFSKR